MSANTYDIRPAILDLASITRAAFVPGVLHQVYDDIPDLQSTTPPVMFFDYIGTAANDGQTYAGHERVMRVDCVAFIGLAQALTLTDQRLKAFVGQMYDLFADNPNRQLNGNCQDCRITGDDSTTFLTLGRQVISALVFHMEITDYVTLQNC